MAEIDRLGWADGLCLETYGLRVGIRVNRPEILDALTAYLPPGWKPASSPVVKRLYSLRAGPASPHGRVRHYNLLYAGTARLVRTMELDQLFEVLESDLHLYVAETAPRRVFVHAGVVGWQGRAILLPGRSFAGKTTLVAALIGAGATYYSDEYAVLDDRGRVHPFPRRLRMRSTDGKQVSRLTAEALGSHPGGGPLPVGLVLFSQYEPGAGWRPRLLSPGRAALELLGNTVPARVKPAAALTTLRHVVTSARTLKSSRGEAETVVPAILQSLAT
jgi:hypothetical protein